jgi:two-component system, NarL family, sensor histidine kinase DegS
VKQTSANPAATGSGNAEKPIIRYLHSPHFWVILVIGAFLAYLYYLPFSESASGINAIWGYRNGEFRIGLSGALFYLPIIYAALVFSWRGIIVSWLVAFLVLVPQIFYFNYNAQTLAINLVILILPTAIALMVILTLSWIKRERKYYVEREIEHQEYISQLIKAQEDERKRLSQEIHDDTIQNLLVIASEIQYAIKKEKNNLSHEFSKQMEQSYASMFQVAEELRRISLDLRPSILDNIGLVEAIRWLVDDLYDKGLNTKFTTSGEIYKLPPDSDVHIFRFVQEGLNNIRKHAEASEIIVRLDYRSDSVEISVQDNGRGFVVPENFENLSMKGKLGIMGMQDRAHLLNGQFKIQSQPGKGATVSISFKTENLAK